MNELDHVAIIMDGNGRWGLKKNKSRNYGHFKGLKSAESAIKTVIKNRIPEDHFLSFFRCYVFT